MIFDQLMYSLVRMHNNMQLTRLTQSHHSVETFIMNKPANSAKTDPFTAFDLHL